MIDLNIPIRDAEPYLIDFGSVQQADTGGEMIPIVRPGARTGLKVQTPPIKDDRACRAQIAIMERAMERKLPVRLAWPQYGYEQGFAGAPLVDGAGQIGEVLDIKSALAGHVLFSDRISISDGTRSYFHKIVGTVQIASDGTASLTLTPPLRVEFADEAVVEVRIPVIEGYLMEYRWKPDLAGYVTMTFDLQEAA